MDAGMSMLVEGVVRLGPERALCSGCVLSASYSWKFCMYCTLEPKGNSALVERGRDSRLPTPSSTALATLPDVLWDSCVPKNVHARPPDLWFPLPTRKLACCLSKHLPQPSLL